MTLIFSQKKVCEITSQSQVMSKATMNCALFFSLHQLAKVPTGITCNSATTIDHILPSYSESYSTGHY